MIPLCTYILLSLVSFIYLLVKYNSWFLNIFRKWNKQNAKFILMVATFIYIISPVVSVIEITNAIWQYQKSL